MQLLIHVIARLLAEAIRWVLNQEISTQAKSVDPQAAAKLLSALGGITILGLGAVVIIAMTGRWFRRLMKWDVRSQPFASSDAQIGKLDWAKTPNAISDKSDFPDPMESESKQSDG